MIDSDDVLLRPLPSTAGFDPLPPRPAPGVQIPASVVGVTIRSLDGPVDVAVVERELLPALATASSPPLAMFVEEASENTFPCATGENGRARPRVDPAGLDAPVAGGAAPSIVRDRP